MAPFISHTTDLYTLSDGYISLDLERSIIEKIHSLRCKAPFISHTSDLYTLSDGYISSDLERSIIEKIHSLESGKG